MAKFEKESLKEQVTHMEEEARMVLPGIQGLFGFQVIAVFNQRFTDLLASEQTLHWLCLFATSVSIALTLAPAAYHRESEPGIVSEKFCKVSSRWLCWSLLPLALGISTDFYLIGALVTQNRILSACLALVLFFIFFVFWYAYPQSQKAKNRKIFPV